jgi:hypothetical protein
MLKGFYRKLLVFTRGEAASCPLSSSAPNKHIGYEISEWRR